MYCLWSDYVQEFRCTKFAGQRFIPDPDPKFVSSLRRYKADCVKQECFTKIGSTDHIVTSSLFLPHQKLPRKRFRKNFGKILTISARFSGHPKRQILGRSGFSYRGQKVWQNFGKCARAQFLCGKKIQPRTVSVGFAGAAAAPQGGRGGMPIAALPSKIAAPDTRASGGSIPRVCSPRRACSVTTATGGGREEL